MVDIDIVLTNYDVYSGALFLRELGSRDTGQILLQSFISMRGRTMPPEINSS